LAASRPGRGPAPAAGAVAVGSILGSVLGVRSASSGLPPNRPGIWVKLDGDEGKSTYVMQPGARMRSRSATVRVVGKRGETRVGGRDRRKTGGKTARHPLKDVPKEPHKS